MASVISSSPRGRRLDRARRPRGCAGRRGTRRRARGPTAGRPGFSTRRTTSPVSVTSATPNWRGSSTLARRIWAVGAASPPRGRRACLEPLDELDEALLEHVVAEVHHEVVVAEEVAGDEHAVREAEGRVLGDVGDVDAPARAVADRGADLVGGVADDDADLADARLGHVLDREWCAAALQTVTAHGPDLRSSDSTSDNASGRLWEGSPPSPLRKCAHIPRNIPMPFPGHTPQAASWPQRKVWFDSMPPQHWPTRWSDWAFANRCWQCWDFPKPP